MLNRRELTFLQNQHISFITTSYLKKNASFLYTESGFSVCMHLVRVILLKSAEKGKKKSSTIQFVYRHCHFVFTEYVNAWHSCNVLETCQTEAF